MRASIYKCPNHLGCTVGYHGDDIEVPDGAPLVCSECGTPLRPAKRSSNKLVPYLINAISVACIAVGLWLAWPSLLKLWKRYVSKEAVPAQATPVPAPGKK